jgi:hypothetical protein
MVLERFKQHLMRSNAFRAVTVLSVKQLSVREGKLNATHQTRRKRLDASRERDVQGYPVS